jgi:hypothetical protein
VAKDVPNVTYLSEYDHKMSKVVNFAMLLNTFGCG